MRISRRSRSKFAEAKILGAEFRKPLASVVEERGFFVI
jgi:hypothetical protein